MNEVAFIASREKDWKRLAYLTDKADASPSQLKGEELKEFIKLYRKSSVDLAKIRTRSTNLALIDFLNDLVGRAYGTIYRPKRNPFWKAIVDAIALAAQTFRKRIWFVAASAAVFFGGVFFAYFSLHFYPRTERALLPEAYKRVFDGWKSGQFGERNLEDSVRMTGMYSFNNPMVAIKSGAEAAASFGFLTTQALWQNGALMGALYFYVQPAGQGPHLIVSVAPHGVTEISGIIVAGAAGYCLGAALIFPGRRKRGDALKEAGKDAIVLLSTSVCLMFMAAPVEGFFSFNPNVQDWMRVTFAVIAACAWAAFWTFFGRSNEETTTTLEQAQA